MRRSHDKDHPLVCENGFIFAVENSQYLKPVFSNKYRFEFQLHGLLFLGVWLILFAPLSTQASHRSTTSISSTSKNGFQEYVAKIFRQKTNLASTQSALIDRVFETEEDEQHKRAFCAAEKYTCHCPENLLENLGRSVFLFHYTDSPPLYLLFCRWKSDLM
jgi:maltodextrin utilization protein YvdJ